MQIAVIDIGSNSIRYMEAGFCGSRPVFSRKEVFTTRLAAGLSESGKLSERAMQSSLCVLSTLARRAENAGLFCAAYATSAVRDADNRAEFLSAVSATAHIAVQVLSGEQEAQFALLLGKPALTERDYEHAEELLVRMVLNALAVGPAA